MLQKEIKFAFRRLFTEPRYFIINLIGLTLGISFSFLIYVFVSTERSYDQHIPGHEHIYRVSADFEVNGQENVFSNAPRPMGYALVNEYEDIISATKFMGVNGLEIHTGYLRSGKDQILSKHLFAVDSNFLEIFQPKMLRGTYEALDEVNSIVLSASSAKNIFGSEEAMGKTLILVNDQSVVVTGIFEDHENKTHLPYEALISYRTFYPNNDLEIYWYGGHVYTYIKTTKKFSLEHFHRNWDAFFQKYMKTRFDELNGYANVVLQPISELYLSPEYIWEPYPHGSSDNLIVLQIIGLILILVACFNYANLGVSQSLYRKEEVSIKKILGSHKIQLIRQHLLCSLIIVFIAGIISMSLLSSFLPFFNYLTKDTLELNFLSNPHLIVMLLGFSILCGFISGIYPAVFEASFGLHTEKSKNDQSNGLLFRRLFVVAQLVISIGLMIFTLVVLDQITYIKNADVGFDNKDVIMVKLNKRNPDEMNAFRELLAGIPSVLNTSSIEETPASGPNEFSFYIQHSEGGYIINPSQTISVSDDFTATLKMDLLAGRTFEKKDDDYQGLIINEFLATKLGYTPEEAIGAGIKFDEEEAPREIIGVVSDFRFGSAQEPTQSMTIGYFASLLSNMLIKIAPQNQQETIKQIEEAWLKTGSLLPFSYSFLQDEYDMLLRKEDKLYKLLVFASILAILISCLGLLGLVTHAISKRTKEIAVRKILGANSSQLYRLLARDFMVSYVIALLIGLSIAWYTGTTWLEGYAFRTSFQWSNIAISGSIGMVVILAALSFHIIHAINTNPADNLRYE